MSGFAVSWYVGGGGDMGFSDVWGILTYLVSTCDREEWMGEADLPELEVCGVPTICHLLYREARCFLGVRGAKKKSDNKWRLMSDN